MDRKRVDSGGTLQVEWRQEQEQDLQCRKQMGFGVVIVADVPCLDRQKRTKAPTWCCAGSKGKLYNEPVSHPEFVKLSWREARRVGLWCFYTVHIYLVRISSILFFLFLTKRRSLTRHLATAEPQHQTVIYRQGLDDLYSLAIDSLCFYNGYESATIRHGCYRQTTHTECA